jgi:hypothetical protein
MKRTRAWTVRKPFVSTTLVSVFLFKAATSTGFVENRDLCASVVCCMFVPHDKCGCSFPVTPEQRERMNELCRQIQVEQDQKKFIALVQELNDLLEQKEHRLEKQTSR